MKPQTLASWNRMEGRFPLTNFLVVIAIIAILAALLLPAWRAKLKATNAACLNNQKTTSLGFIMYADDNGDKMIYTVGAPGSAISRRLLAGSTTTAANRRIHTLHEKLGLRSAGGNGLRKGALFRFVNAPLPIIAPVTCAQNDFCLEKAMLKTVSSKMEGMNGAAGTHCATPYEKLSTGGKPSEAMVFYRRSDPRDYNLCTWVVDVKPSPGWVDGFAIFHGFVTTISFGDGHGETHRWTEPAVIKAGIDFAKRKPVFLLERGNARTRIFSGIYQRYSKPASRWRSRCRP